MAVKKRQLEESTSVPKSKKTKLATEGKKEKKVKPDQPTQQPVHTAPEEVDFPRGGGSSFTPLEVKTIRAEAVKEANDELFKDKANVKKLKKQRSKADVKGKGKATGEGINGDALRIEHLNYKRIAVGMKILGQVVSVQPLALIVSLPNQLLGHIPITQISSELTTALETMDANEDEGMSSVGEDDDEKKTSAVPDLHEIFEPGQYVRCVVTAVHEAGSTEGMAGVGRGKSAVEKSSRRVELSLLPEQVNEGVVKSDLKPGFTMSAAVKSVEDHGYILNLGLTNISGFLSSKEVAKSIPGKAKLHVGRILDVSVVKLSSNGRTCTVSTDSTGRASASLTEVTSVTSILPGELVQCLITAVLPTGLNFQVLGFFDGIVDSFHLPPGDPTTLFKIGQKVKARVLYEIPGNSPPRFSLSLSPHILALDVKHSETEDKAAPTIKEAYPIGTILEAVRVVRVETERGLVVEVRPGIQGFIHISHVSDDHVPSLSPSSGAWKLNSTHRARVTGYHPLDGLLQLSLKTSILEQKFLQVSDVQVGEVVKGTVKILTDTALFVSISGAVDGVVFPNHYADILLKQPQKRFKPGANIKCRVFTVDPERRRISLTAKKTLVESELPIITKFEEAKVGMLTHAVIFRISERRLQIEFFNNVKASVPQKEASDSATPLATAFSVGKPVKVRIIAVNPEDGHITASIRQAAVGSEPAVADISGVEIGHTVDGDVAEIHPDNALIILKPTGIRALLSLKNLANARKVPVAQLRGALSVGEHLDDLVVVSRNPEKGIVIVANRPKTKPALEHSQPLTIDTVEISQVVGGRVLRHHRNGTLLKLSSSVTGTLHPTDVSDNYDVGNIFPQIDSIVKASVLSIDKEKKQLALSSRQSRLHPDNHPDVVDREIKGVSDLKVGETIRGFIKSVAEHGLFVTLGRDVDARVQIKELFDEYVKDWKPRFQVNQLVKGRVLRIDAEKKQVELTFRSGDLSRSKPSITLSDLEEGQKVEGRVKRVEEYGLFIEIDGSKLSGLCHKSELTDNKDADVTLALRSFREGDRVKALIRSIDLEKKRISLGLKPSYFAVEDLEVNEDDSDDEADPEALGVVDNDVEMSDDGEAPEESDEASEPDAGEEGSDDEEEDDMMAMDVDMAPLDPVKPVTTTSSRPPPVPSLKLQGGFQWSTTDAQPENDDESDESDDSDVGESSDKKKKKRKRKEIELDVTADLQTKTPESNADFERNLLGSPNSSFLWIQYMSFQLQLSEIEKAREIAKRALATINFREEREKLNVWIALLNLENIYGTDESLDAAFKDAARHCDSKTVHLRLAAILEESEKLEKTEEHFKRTCKKFGQSSKVWTLFGEFYFRHDNTEEARKLLPRSLQSLEKRKHLKTISKFAQLEYKLGDPERGKTIFEGIVDSHPKRWDLWTIYLDMEAGQKDIQHLRNLFDRVLAQKMTSHKAKTFFKKWLELERRLGDEEGATLVKQKAIEWTQRAANNGSAEAEAEERD